MDSLLLGKNRYNLATWGNMNMKNKNKINNTIKKYCEMPDNGFLLW